MNYFRVLKYFYPDKNFLCQDTYESLEWRETSIPKPTKEELFDLYESVKNEWALYEIREERNQLLKESDYTVLPDFPTTNKQAWLDYREKLRDFPSVWSVGVPFPTIPIL